MSLSIDDVRHIARLARLALTDEEVETLRGELGHILAYAEKVGEVATSDVSPTSHPYALRNVWRADEPRPCLPRDDLLQAAPQVEEGRFRVPRILGGPS